ncbi:MAG: hypothetical protein HZC01_01075 [Candidatus Kerfeldbacteria bacterium]|nr:hypothetical protein [Candidatus Kerfeldbacteria bacterium]
MDFIYLAMLFLGAGIAGLVYYRYAPTAVDLRERLPNRVTPAGIVLAVAIGSAAWFLFSSVSGVVLVGRIFLFIFSLLFFESIFLLAMRWISRNTFATVVAILSTLGMFWWYQAKPSFVLLNFIIIISTLGAVTLLTRLGYLRTKILFAISILWTIYDILLVRFILPDVTRETATPHPTFLYPAVTTGRVSLGSGDFMFLSLFTLVIARDVGPRAALVHVVAQVTGLLVTGLLLPERGFTVPFLVVMTPIFIVCYVLMRNSGKK